MKRVIVIMSFILLLTGCNTQKDEALDKEIVTNENKLAASITEIDTDKLVDYALNNINFRFVSDDGYYDGWWIIHEYVEDEIIIKQVEIMTLYINMGDFESLSEIINDVPDYNNYVKEIKINYIVPILMSQNNYKDALKIVQEKYKYEPELSGRFRFDSVYLHRYMYLNNGFDYSTKIIDELQKEYPDNDLSYVWLAISERNFHSLYSNGYCEPFSSDSDEYKLLEYIVANHPEDKFIDHAYYYMGDYDKIISEYKDSDILDRAVYAKANTVFKEITQGDYGYNFDITVEELDLATQYFSDYLNNYGESKFTYHAVRKLLTLSTKHYMVTGDDSYYYRLIAIINTLKNADLEEYVVRIIKREYIQNDDFIGLDDTLAEQIAQTDNEYVAGQILCALAHNAFDHDKLDESFSYFAKVNYAYYDYRDKRRINTLYSLSQYKNSNKKDDLFSIAYILRQHDEHALAIKYYEKIEEKNISNDERSRVNMLKASSYRELKEFGQMLSCYEYIAYSLTDTAYADDALAEIGVYHLLYEREHDKARRIFREVIDKYSNSNAVDNSYNWIAWSYLKAEDYPAALKAYQELEDKFPLNKYGTNAKFNIKKIEDLMR